MDKRADRTQYKPKFIVCMGEDMERAQRLLDATFGPLNAEQVSENPSVDEMIADFVDEQFERLKDWRRNDDRK